jgi:hypothetical protein
MASTLPTTLEEVVKAVIQDDVAIQDYFTSQGRVLQDALFPRAQDESNPYDILGPNTPTPFLIVEVGGRAGNMAIYSDVTIRVYDTPTQRYWRIEDIIQRLSVALNHKMMPQVEDGYTAWQRTDLSYVSPRLTDPDWNMNTMYVRFIVYGM